MATNKNAMLRYLVLDRCFQNKRRRYSIKDLVDECNNALYGHYGSGVTVEKRQVYNDITFMESEAGWAVPLEKTKEGRSVYYHYGEDDFSINQCPLKESEMQPLKQAIMMLGRLKGLPQYDWMQSVIPALEDKLKLKRQDKCVLGFDQNIDYSGSNYIAELFDFISNKQVLHIGYSTFGGEHHVWVVHPYYLKQYNNRWFLLGGNDNHLDQIVTIPLDRIKHIEPLNNVYIDTEIDFDEYFDDVIGVTIPKHKTIEEVVLRFSSERYPYVVSKPPHHTMKRDDTECQIRLKLIPNKELKALILSYGKDVEVISPQYLRDEIKEHIATLCELYK